MGSKMNKTTGRLGRVELGTVYTLQVVGSLLEEGGDGRMTVTVTPLLTGMVGVLGKPEEVHGLCPATQHR